MNENDLSCVIVDVAIEVHKTLGGPGLLESIYRDAMVIEFRRRGIAFEKEKLIPVIYKGEILNSQCTIKTGFACRQFGYR